MLVNTNAPGQTWKSGGKSNWTFQQIKEARDASHKALGKVVPYHAQGQQPPNG